MNNIYILIFIVSVFLISCQKVDFSGDWIIEDKEMEILGTMHIEQRDTKVQGEMAWKTLFGDIAYRSISGYVRKDTLWYQATGDITTKFIVMTDKNHFVSYVKLPFGKCRPNWEGTRKQ